MEADKNPMPDFRVYQMPETLKKVGRFISERLLGFHEVPLHMSDHYVREHFVDDKQRAVAWFQNKIGK